MLCLISDGHSQFPSALYGSIYSELGEADEALSFLILQAKTDGGWRCIVNTQNKMSCILICYFYLGWQQSSQHTNITQAVCISWDKLRRISRV